MTKSRWPNEYDQPMTTTNLIFWIWPKLKPTNHLFGLLYFYSEYSAYLLIWSFFGVKLMLVVGVMKFGQIQKVRFVVVKIFRSYSNQFSVILIWSSWLTSIETTKDNCVKFQLQFILCVQLINTIKLDTL